MWARGETAEHSQLRGATPSDVSEDTRVRTRSVAKARAGALAWEETGRGAHGVVLLLFTARAEFQPRRLGAEARLRVDTRNATGARGELPHVVRL